MVSLLSKKNCSILYLLCEVKIEIKKGGINYNSSSHINMA